MAREGPAHGNVCLQQTLTGPAACRATLLLAPLHLPAPPETAPSAPHPQHRPQTGPSGPQHLWVLSDGQQLRSAQTEPGILPQGACGPDRRPYI